MVLLHSRSRRISAVLRCFGANQSRIPVSACALKLPGRYARGRMRKTLLKTIKPPCGGVPFMVRVKDQAEFARRLRQLEKEHEPGGPGLPIL